MNRYVLLLILFFYMVITSCEKELELNFPDAPSKIVVEGWIENGQFAEVILSHTAPYFSDIDSTNINEFAETHAKVTLSEIAGSEILTMKPNQSYFPPFVYKSTELKGETGKTYTLEIIYEKNRVSDTLTATTSIPDPVELDSVWFQPDPGKSNKGRLWIRLTDDGSKVNYYRLLYKRKGKDEKYTATNISTFSDVMINGKTAQMGFLRGMSSLIAIEQEHYFETSDTISVKFCSIDETQFNFWNVYQSKVIASANPLATSNNQLQSNISGGLGIWSGYGASYYTVYGK